MDNSGAFAIVGNSIQSKGNSCFQKVVKLFKKVDRVEQGKDTPEVNILI